MSDFFDTDEFKQAVYNQLGLTGTGEISIKCPKPENHKNADSKPSASLNRDSGRWYCHGCGAKGNAYQLAQASGIDPKTLASNQKPVTWDYVSQSGMYLRVARFPGKQFRQQTYRNGSWTWKGLDRGDLALPLYADKLKKHQVVYVVEGEKDVDTLARHGLQATTGAGGSKAAHKTDWSVLHGFKVIVIPDCDEPGAQFVNDFDQHFQQEFRVIDLTEHATKPGYDISDYLVSKPFSELNSVSKHQFQALNEPEIQPAELDVTRSELHQLPWELVSKTFEHKNASTLAEIFDKLGISIRYEVRAGKRQIRINGSWKNIDDFNTSALRELLRDNCTYWTSAGKVASLNFGHAKGYWNECLNALLNEPERRVDSFLRWLERDIPTWDGIERLDRLCADMFDTDHSDLLAWASRYPFIGPIQRAYEPGSKIDEIPVFYGDQGTGKSTFIKEVLPEKSHMTWHLEGINFAADEKKFVESLLGRVIVEAGEMVGANRAENNLMKALITRQIDSIRLSYAEYVTDFPRRCVIIGSTDSTDALPNDPAGNRRFVIIQLAKGSNVEAHFNELCNETDTTRSQLWAEAMVMYHERKIRANLPRELHEARNLSNRLFRNVGDSIEETILETAEQFKSLSFSLVALKDRFPVSFSVSDRVIGSALLNNGYRKKQERIHGRRRWLYEKTEEQ